MGKEKYAHLASKVRFVSRQEGFFVRSRLKRDKKSVADGFRHEERNRIPRKRANYCAAMDFCSTKTQPQIHPATDAASFAGLDLVARV